MLKMKLLFLIVALFCDNVRDSVNLINNTVLLTDQWLMLNGHSKTFHIWVYRLSFDCK